MCIPLPDIKLSDLEKYYYMIWVPGDREYYNKLKNEDLQKALDDVSVYALEHIDSWYVAPDEKTANKLEKEIIGANNGTMRILGFSGTGKSTLLRVTVKRLIESNEDYKHDVIDLRNQGQDIGEESWKEKFGKCSKATRKLIQCLIDTVLKYARVEDTADEKRVDHIRSELKAMHDNYIELFPATVTAYRKFFHTIYKFSNGEENYRYGTGESAYDEENYHSDIKNAIFNSCAASDIDIDTRVEVTLERLLTLCLIIQLSSHKIESIINHKYRHYLAIDNIEHFIDGDIVHAHDIEIFLKVFRNLQETQTNTDSVFSRLGESILSLRNDPKYMTKVEQSTYAGSSIPLFQIFVKIVLVMREVTSYSEDKYFTRDARNEESDFSQTSNQFVNITDAFHAREIIEKKMKFYESAEVKAILQKHGIVFPDTNDMIVWEAVREALADSAETGGKTGNPLWDRIEHRYSHNVRRIVDNIFYALMRNKTATEKYSSLVQGEAMREASLLKSCIQNGARQIIARLLWDLVSHETKPKYFERIGEFVRDDESNYGQHRGLGRRIATMLAGLPEDCDPLPLSVFLQRISPKKLQNGSCDDEFLGCLADVLFAMYEREKRKTKWAPLVMLKYRKADDFTRDDLFGTIKDIRDCNNENNAERKKEYDDRFGIKVTKAGEYFALTSVEWEYFAAIASSSYNPLFTYDNIRDESNAEKVKEAVDNVLSYATREISASFAEDKRYVERIDRGTSTYFYSELYNPRPGESWLYKYNSRKLFTHAQRIILSHIVYLENYRYYVTSMVCRNAEGFGLLSKNSEEIKAILDSEVMANKNTKSELANALEISVHLLGAISKYIGILTDLSSEDNYDVKGQCYYIGGTERSKDSPEDFFNSRFQYKWYLERMEKGKAEPLRPYHIINSEK